MVTIISILVASIAASDLSRHRLKRQNNEDSASPGGPAEGEAEGEGEAEPSGSKGPSLGMILGLVFLVCVILYCIGISWKVYKVCKGTYVEEEPVFLKYKWRMNDDNDMMTACSFISAYYWVWLGNCWALYLIIVTFFAELYYYYN